MDSTINLSTDQNSQSLLNNKIDELTKYKKLGEPSQKVLSDSEKVEYAKAARGFEAMFVNMLIKEMKLGSMDEGDSDGESSADTGFGADTLKSYANMQLSEQISKTGSGIGIAEKIYQQLTGEKLSPITVEKVAASTGSTASILDELKNVSNTSVNADAATATNNSFIDRVSNRLKKYESIINDASEKYEVPSSLIKSVIAAESAGRNEVSSKVGAKGLMQLMDGTAKSMGVNNSYDPVQNIMGGTKYLKSLMDKFSNLDNVIAAYNAGPGNVQKYNGVPPFQETVNYVKKVKNYLNEYFA